MTRINLIPPEILERRAVRLRCRWWGVRLGILATALAVVYLGILHIAAGSNSEVQETVDRYARLQERMRQAENLIAERNRLAERREAIASLRENQPAGLLFEEIGEVMPPEVYLRLLTLDRPSVVGVGSERRYQEGAKPSSLRLQGYAAGHQQVGDIIRRLRNTGHFTRVDLLSVGESNGQSKVADVQFELSCLLAEREE